MNSSELKGYLTGLIVGDGYIDKGVTKRAFEIKNTQKEFIDQIENDINSCTNFKTCVLHYPERYANGCRYKEHWGIRIKANPYFCKKYHHFYDDNRKRRVTKEACGWMNDRGLANWYMSDGYVCLVGKTKGEIRQRRVDICTDRYDIDSIHRLQDMLHDKFNVDTTLNKRGNVHRIRIRQRSYETFFSIIEPYVVNSMRYKLYLGYNEKPKWMSDEFWCLQQHLCSANTLTSNVEG